MKKSKWKLTDCKVLLVMEVAMLAVIVAPIAIRAYQGDYSVLPGLFIIATAGSANVTLTRGMIAEGY